jgi:hypothetical protein
MPPGHLYAPDDRKIYHESWISHLAYLEGRAKMTWGDVGCLFASKRR